MFGRRPPLPICIPMTLSPKKSGILGAGPSVLLRCLDPQAWKIIAKATFNGAVSHNQHNQNRFINYDVWANYNDVSRGHPKWWFNKGTFPKSP